MRLSKEVIPSLGFDLDEACGTLMQWLLDAQVVSEQQLDERTEVVDLSDGTRRVEGGEALVEIAMVHGQLHFARPETFGARIDHVPFCNEWPCRAVAVSFGLWEIGDYLVDFASGLPAYASDLDDLARQLNKIDGNLLARLRERARPQNTVRPETGFPILPAPPERQILELVTALEDAPSTLSGFAKEIRAELTSKQLHEGWSPRGGRRSDVLLTAVWQHLAAGEFSPAEIARLVPDSIRGNNSNLIERIRSRIRGEERRSVIPWHAGMSESALDAS